MPRPTQVQHGLARLQLGQRRRVATAQRGDDGLHRKDTDLRGIVEVAGDRIAAPAGVGAAATAPAVFPSATRRAASPYLSFTTDLMSATLSPAIATSLGSWGWVLGLESWT